MIGDVVMPYRSVEGNPFGVPGGLGQAFFAADAIAVIMDTGCVRGEISDFGTRPGLVHSRSEARVRDVPAGRYCKQASEHIR